MSTWLLYNNWLEPKTGMVATLMESMQIRGEPHRDYPMLGEAIEVVGHTDVRVPAEFVEAGPGMIVVKEKDGRILKLTPWRPGDMPSSHRSSMYSTDWTVREVIEPKPKAITQN